MLLVLDFGLQAAVDTGAHGVAETPAGERLRLDVLAVFAARLDAEDAVHDDLETAEAAAGGEQEFHFALVRMEPHRLEPHAGGQIEAV